MALPPGHRSNRARSGGAISASGLSGSSRPAFTVEAKITGVEKTTAEFKAARRHFNSAMRDVIAAAGEQAVLPRIKTILPSRRFGASLYVKRDRTTVFIGSRMRGRLNRAVGWLDFGGRRTGDRSTRDGPHTIVNTLHSKRAVIDTAILAGVLKTFDPIEHRP